LPRDKAEPGSLIPAKLSRAISGLEQGLSQLTLRQPDDSVLAQQPLKLTTNQQLDFQL